MKIAGLIAVVTAAVVLVACGGGGGSSAPTGPVTSSLSFPLRSAVNTITANGRSYTLTANGTTATQSTDGLCSGTLSSTDAPANVSTTFEGNPALSSVGVSTLSFTNCTPSSFASTGTAYYDVSYLPLGNSDSGGTYGVYLTPPVIPTTVRVGDAGLVGTVTYYTNSTKATGDGRSDKSFVVEADTANTAVVNLISKRYNSSSQLLYTEQSRTRIDAAGNITQVSIDVQYATTSTVHLVFR